MRISALLLLMLSLCVQSCSTKPRVVKSPCVSFGVGEPCEKRAVNNWLDF